MLAKIKNSVALMVFFGVSSSAFSSSNDQPALMAPKASESILLDISRTGTGSRLVVAGDRGHILYSDDNGDAWKQAAVPTQKMINAISFPTEKTGYAVGHDAIILKTTNGGTSWTKIYDDFEQGVPLLDIHFLNKDSGLAVGAYGLALKTEDGGQSWESISTKIGNRDELHLNAISGTSENLYLAGEQGILFHSGDLGQNWQPLSSGYNGSWFGMVTNTHQTLWLYGLRGTVFRSDNQGKSWLNKDIKAKQTLFGGTLLNDQSPVLVGDAGTISIKQNDHWYSWQLEDRATLSAALTINDRHLIVVGEMGVKKIALEKILSGAKH